VWVGFPPDVLQVSPPPAWPSLDRVTLRDSTYRYVCIRVSPYVRVIVRPKKTKSFSGEHLACPVDVTL